MSHIVDTYIQEDNIGTSLRMLVQDEDGLVDISSATLIQIILQKPDETSVTKTAVLVTDGTDGLMQYVTISGDLDQPGTWKIQGRVQFSPSLDYFTKPVLFRVGTNL